MVDAEIVYQEDYDHINDSIFVRARCRCRDEFYWVDRMQCLRGRPVMMESLTAWAPKDEDLQRTERHATQMLERVAAVQAWLKR